MKKRTHHQTSKDQEQVTVLSPRQLAQAVGGSGSDGTHQGRRSTGGYVPT